MTVAPADTLFAPVGHGRVAAWAPAITASWGSGLRPRRPLDASVPPSWVRLGSSCFERVADLWSWIDHCYELYGLAFDGDAQLDTYALVRTATAGPNWPWVVKAASIGSQALGGTATQSWRDWSPRSDHSGPCGPFSVSIRSPLPGAETLVERCETWNITKGSAGGAFSVAWSGCACTDDRELASVIAVSVPQGSSVGWVLPASVAGFAF